MGEIGIFGLIHLAIWVYAVIRIFDSDASGGAKALWILIVAVLPVLGIILWFFLGPGTGRR